MRGGSQAYGGGNGNWMFGGNRRTGSGLSTKMIHEFGNISESLFAQC